MRIRLLFWAIASFAQVNVVIASSGTFEVFVDGLRSEYTIQKYPRLLDLRSVLPSNRVIDGLIWLRSSHRAYQERQREQCRLHVTQLTPGLLPRDLLVKEKSLVKQRLEALVIELRATGRVLEYGSLDPVDLEAADFFNRKIRNGDQFILDQRLELVWTWDYRSGWRERAHRPTNAAKDYALEALSSESARGDWAYQISPSGEITRVGLARFNESTDAVPTGSMLFFPPPGFGRGNQPAYECIASLIALQHPSSLNALQWWTR